jgi:hypothetical protein
VLFGVFVSGLFPIPGGNLLEFVVFHYCFPFFFKRALLLWSFDTVGPVTEMAFFVTDFLSHLRGIASLQYGEDYSFFEILMSAERTEL